MDAQNRKRQRPATAELDEQQQEKKHNDNDDYHNDYSSIATAKINFVNNGRATNGNNVEKEKEAFKCRLRMTDLEFKCKILVGKNKILEGQNQMLQGKLEYQEFRTKIRAMVEGSRSRAEKLKQENTALWKSLEETVEEEQIANYKLEKIKEAVQQYEAENKEMEP